MKKRLFNTLSKREKILILAVLILGLTGVFLLARGSDDSQVSYTEIKVSRGSIQEEIAISGSVQPDNRIEIKPPLSGRIETILVTEGQHVKQGDVLAWMSSSERAIMLDNARAQSNDEYKRWQEFYKPTPIYAPIEGDVIKRSVEQGQSFSTSDTILVLADRLIIQGYVDETDVAKLREQQNAKVVLDAYQDDTVDASIERISREATNVDDVTKYAVDIIPAKVPAEWRSYMTATITFVVARHDNVLLLPIESILTENKDNVVLMPPIQEKPKSQIVTIGLTDGKMIEILSGLSEGDTILVKDFGSEQNEKKRGLFSFSGKSKK